MQSAKKRTRALSALAMAAAGTLVAQAASGAVLTLYYNSGTTIAGATNNTIRVATASNLTTGSTSAGNNTFLMRLPEWINDPEDSLSAVVNHVHGSSPQKRNTGNGASAGSRLGSRYENTKE